jgi:uridine kinase
LRDNDIILIDSLYGLYPAMVDVQNEKTKIYIEPLLQMKNSNGQYIRWADIRLMRRMLRDKIHRAYDYRSTLTHWHYVRKHELKYLIPYNKTADYVINSAMPYELSIYRPKLMDHFCEWIGDYKDDPLRRDAFSRASRVYELLKEVAAITDETIVPTDSVIREFIGNLKLE